MEGVVWGRGKEVVPCLPLQPGVGKSLVLKDSYSRLPPQPSPAGWGQSRRELTSALWTLVSQPGVSSRGAVQLGG